MQERGTPIFTGRTSDGDSDIFEVKGSHSEQNQAEAVFVLKGTGDLGGGKVTILIDYSDDDFAPVVKTSDGSTLEFTKPFAVELLAKTGMRIKGNLSNSSNANFNLKVL